MKEITFYSDNNSKEEKELLKDENYLTNLVARKYLNNEIVIKPMFTVPLLHIKMSNWDVKKQKLLELFSSSQKWLINRESVNTTYVNSIEYREKLQEEIVDREEWSIKFSETISDIFDEEAKIIYETFGNPQECPDKTATIGYSWFQEQKRGMCHAPHTHGNGGLSAVCFIEYDQNFHTPTEFLSPYLNPAKGHNELYVEKNISSGSLIVFPSNIVHYTLPSESDKSRIILSLNISI